jgi:energy-coupling factor transport system ATP-binding protein
VARLEAADLHFRYGRKTDAVLSGVNLEGRGGDIIALAGPNGAGKTTLAMVLCGLLRARSGLVRIDGACCRASRRISRCRLVFQETEHQLFTESVFREVALGLVGNGGRERVMELLAAVGLSDQSRRRPRRLSGGEKQRLAVAAAMAAGPAVLILDEPTSGLDAGNMMRMGALLKQAAHGGALVVVVTHDEQFIQTCCTHVLRMENGGIVDG